MKEWVWRPKKVSNEIQIFFGKHVYSNFENEPSLFLIQIYISYEAKGGMCVWSADCSLRLLSAYCEQGTEMYTINRKHKVAKCS